MSGIVVGGMHRSGTSLTTRFLAAGGWDPGEKLLRNGDEQYFEDDEFVGLHRKWLAECRPTTLREPPDVHHLDWGIVDGVVVDPSPATDVTSTQRRAQVTRFVERRSSRSSQWVAKDPRCTLFLDEWTSIADLRFVLVYRNPWDVIESAMHLGHGPFCRRPSLARNAWLGYNRSVVDFTRRHRDRVFLIATENLVSPRNTIADVLGGFIDASKVQSKSLIDPQRFTSRGDDRAIASVYRDIYPEHVALLHELDELADRPRTQLPRPRSARRALPGGSLESGLGLQVVTACRNDGDFLAEAVASVDEIADERIELTIVDDGSTDIETLRVIDRLRQTGRQVITTSGVGLSAARNQGIAVSRTRAVISLDADNRLRPAVSDALELLMKNDLDVVHGAWQRFGMDDHLVVPPDLKIDSLLPYNRIDACAVVSRRVLVDLGGWDEALPFWEDWDLWLGVAGMSARTRRIDEALFEYLVRLDSLGDRARVDLKSRASVCRYVLRKHRRVIGWRRWARARLVHEVDLTIHYGRHQDTMMCDRAVDLSRRSTARILVDRLLKDAPTRIRAASWRLQRLAQRSEQR